MGDFTKEDAIKIVRRNLEDQIEASYLDARFYVEDRAGALLSDDEHETISDALGAEVEALLLSIDKAVASWIY